MAGCGVRRGGKYAGGLVQRYGTLLGNRQAQIDAAVDGTAPPVQTPAPTRVATPAAPAASSKSYEQLDAEIAAARAKMNAPKKFLGMFKDGAVIPGHDTEGSDDVDVKVTRGEAILPVNTVDAMGGPMAVSDMIHATNGKPPAGVRRGGGYADGATDDGIFSAGGGQKKVYLGDMFKPGAGARPLSSASVITTTPPPAPVSATAAPSLADQIPNEFRPGAGVAAPPTTPIPVPAPAPTVTLATAAPTPSSDPRLAALGVKSDWKKMTEAAGQPIQNAEIYTTGRSAAGYGTQTPETEAAAQAKAEANRKSLAGIYERESQARLGARIAQARAQGEDTYADSLEKQQTQQGAALTAGAQAKAALAGSEGLGELRAAQTSQIGQELKQGSTKQAITDEYLNASTTPERRKVLAATLGIKPDSGWQISTTFGPPDTMGQPTKSTIAHRTTASGELETRDLSGGVQQAKAPLPPKNELKTGQIYPGYGKWTGTGFLPQ